MDADFARAADLLEVVAEGLVDPSHQLIDLGHPYLHQLLDLPAQVLELVGHLLFPLGELLDIPGALLELPEDLGVNPVHHLQARVLGVDIAIYIFDRLAFADDVETLKAIVIILDGLLNFILRYLGLLSEIIYFGLRPADPSLRFV